MHESTDIQATVIRLFDRGVKSYVLTLKEDKNITFSLSNWDGEYPPQPEQVVILKGVQLFKKGWRAQKASPIRIEQSEREAKNAI